MNVGAWLGAACRDRRVPTPSGLSKHCSNPERGALNPDPLPRVMLFDSRKCVLNCRHVGIGKGMGETSDMAALQLREFGFRQRISAAPYRSLRSFRSI
jgi:hypothetical protein